MSKLRLRNPDIANIDATLESRKAADEPDSEQFVEDLEQELTAIDAAPAIESPVTPPARAEPPVPPPASVAPPAAAPDPLVPLPSGTTSIGFAAAPLADSDVENSAPRIGRRGMLQLTSVVVLAGLAGSLIGWYVVGT